MGLRSPVVSTYRVQVRPEFDLAATADLAGYLAGIGATHLYTAPLLTAVPGSAHGYDVVDHREVSPALGGEDGRRALVAALRTAGLGLVVDIVPNHAGVAVPHANGPWWDVLRLGRASAYACWFDIDWSRGRLLVPVLADSQDGGGHDGGGPDGGGHDALGDLRLDGGELCYFDRRYPVAPGTGDGDPRAVHDRQHYELVSWRRGDTELNYRRFFAIADLAGLRVEGPVVFEATHAEILRWYGLGELDGIRVDHPDGLADPAGYLRRLRAAAPSAWLVVEKILEPGEVLPAWPVEGSTGYDALRDVGGVFIDPAAEPAFTPPGTTPWAAFARSEKRSAAHRLFGAELARLSRIAVGVPDAADALAEVAAGFGVYRSYLPDGRAHLDAALAEARGHRPDLAATVDALAVRLRDPADELAIRFQQLTGAVMAKGVEDTAFYRWTRFVALNEVGGDPSRFGLSLAAFHAGAADRHEHWPAGMTTLSTHDTKRGEDVRARLAVLSEVPAAWRDALTRWSTAAPLPDSGLANLLWQSVVGAWPIERERLHAYAEKAAREAGTNTGWTAPDDAFEKPLHALVDRLYDDQALRADLDRFVAGLTADGWSNALGQKLVQLSMPGVPDTYQGSELWDNSLVDPDNRRPVDFDLRRGLLTRLDDGWLPPIDATGAVKLLVVSRALRLRRDRSALFTRYAPVPVDGPGAEHALVFDRGGAITVVTRLPVGLRERGGWGETSLGLPAGRWVDMITARPVEDGRLAAVLRTYPVALLVRAV